MPSFGEIAKPVPRHRPSDGSRRLYCSSCSSSYIPTYIVICYMDRRSDHDGAAESLCYLRESKSQMYQHRNGREM